MNYARANHIPRLLEVNAPLIEEQEAHRGLLDRASADQVATRVFTDATALLAVSDEVGQYLRQRGARPEIVQVIPNGVNPERFPADLAATWGWPQNEATFTVGFVGTLKPWHGVSVLLEAFAQLHRQHHHARLLLVGEGPERANLAARIKELGLESVTYFTGAVAANEIPGLLSAMDVAVAPYPQLDNFYFSPLKAYEYMAAGCATVASRIGQLTDLIVHEQNGLLCEPGNANDLATQLARLCSDPTLRQQLGTAGRRTILQGHTWDHVAGRILELGNQSARAERGSVTRSATPPSDCCGSQSRAPLGINSNKCATQYEVR